MKYLIFSVFVFFFSCAGNKFNKATLNKEIREYAFCLCLNHAFSDTVSNSILKEDMSLPMYFDVTNHANGQFFKLDSLSKKFALSIQPSQIQDYSNRKPIIAKCFEFSKSNEIDSIVENE